MPKEDGLSPEKSLKMKKTKLKEMSEILSEDFDRIKNKIKSTENEFAEPRVQEFWRRAQTTNFTGEKRLARRNGGNTEDRTDVRSKFDHNCIVRIRYDSV